MEQVLKVLKLEFLSGSNEKGFSVNIANQLHFIVV
jgi:hypothetical protein